RLRSPIAFRPTSRRIDWRSVAWRQYAAWCGRGRSIRAALSDLELWCARTSECPYDELYAEFGAILSAEEQNRLTSFAFQKDKHAYLLAHALKRSAIAAFRGVSASSLVFHVATGGKPVVEGGPEFNLSHTSRDDAGVAVVVLSDDEAVGVDIETIERGSEIAELLSR